MILKMLTRISLRVRYLKHSTCFSTSIQYSKHGYPSAVLNLVEDTDDQRPLASQVSVKMLAAPINPADLNMVYTSHTFKLISL